MLCTVRPDAHPGRDRNCLRLSEGVTVHDAIRRFCRGITAASTRTLRGRHAHPLGNKHLGEQAISTTHLYPNVARRSILTEVPTPVGFVYLKPDQCARCEDLLHSRSRVGIAALAQNYVSFVVSCRLERWGCDTVYRLGNRAVFEDSNIDDVGGGSDSDLFKTSWQLRASILGRICANNIWLAPGKLIIRDGVL